MLTTVGDLRAPDGSPVQLRIGIHAGPLVAGVIGDSRFHYDLWGDTVNIASRMEAMSEPGRIQVTEEIYRRLRDRFEFEPRGKVEVKGKGRLDTWYLVGRKPSGG